MLRAQPTSGSERRRRYFVDPEVQGSLLRQAIWHWFWASATFVMVVFVFRVFPELLSGKNRIWHHVAPYFVASIAFFPIAVFSAIRFSNRFVGPMVRVRRALKQLARGETPAPIVLRKHDFWLDIAEDINEISSRENSAHPTATASSHAGEEILVSAADDGSH